MSGGELKMKCADVQPLLVFFACDEVSVEEREAIGTHLGECPVCAALLSEEKSLQDELAAMPQSADELDRAGVLLAQCRSELSESLDQLNAPAPEPEKWRPFGFARRWMALRPGWSAAGLLAAGAVLGVQLLQWLPVSDSGLKGAPVSVSAAPKLSAEQLEKMAVSGINFAPSVDAAPGTLQVQLSAEQPVTLSGSLDDDDVRRVLTYVVTKSDRFDAGVRLDCMEALKARVKDAEIRRAMIEAASKDQNPAVRMKALEALREVAGEEDVRAALLERLNIDSNPGVRVEAVNLLVRSLESLNRVAPEAPDQPDNDMPMVVPDAPAVALPASDPSVRRVVKALEDLRLRDPNRYVRLRSAAALRQIGPAEVQ
jgi:hypothetical protein